jgi:hypothetical protein
MMWNNEQAQQFLDSISRELAVAGLSAEIVGSVKLQGQSDHDLDILTTVKGQAVHQLPEDIRLRQLAEQEPEVWYGYFKNNLDVLGEELAKCGFIIFRNPEPLQDQLILDVRNSEGKVIQFFLHISEVL